MADTQAVIDARIACHGSDRPCSVKHPGRPRRTPRRQTVEGCRSCIDYSTRTDHFPWHDASSGCESGKREHCSCEVCF